MGSLEVNEFVTVKMGIKEPYFSTIQLFTFKNSIAIRLGYFK